MKRRVHGIGWMYLAVLIMIVRLITGPWPYDVAWFTVAVFAFVSVVENFQASLGERDVRKRDEP